MFGLSDVQFQSFIEKVSAAAIANQAMWRCQSRGLPLTENNVISVIGTFFDPTAPEFESLIDKINDAIDYVVAPMEDVTCLGGYSDGKVVQLRR